MNPTFASITAALSQNNGLIRLANTGPDASEYLLTTYLPSIQRPDYNISGGVLKVQTIMAGLVGMDSPYPRGSAIQLSTFTEKTAKIAMSVGLSEESRRELNRFIQFAKLGQLNGQTEADVLSAAALNLYEKGCIQAIDDTEEYLRAQALTTGALNWTFNGKTLQVDYQLPAANKFAQRTGSDGYGGSTSKFWTDAILADQTVLGAVGYVMSMSTLNMIINNPANNIRVIADTYSPQRNIRRVQIVRAVQTAQGISVGTDTDARYALTLIAYARKGQIIDPTTPGATIGVQMIPDGVISVVGQQEANQLISVDGTAVPQYRLGYFHVAPTVEGENVGSPLGRWGRLYTPQDRPWEVQAEAVENGLPVIEAPERLVILRTA